jgi:dephospho-CoA kinase
MKRRKVVVGLTGGYGSGKSSAAKIFQDLGADMADADALAREALSPGRVPYKKAVRAFGRGIVFSDGTLDRARLAEIIFNNTAARRRLERIVHPYVIAKLKDKIKNCRRGVLVLEIPLLFESGLAHLVDHVAVVWAPVSVRKARLSKKGVGSPDFRRREKAQWSLDRKRRNADVVIDNGLSAANTRRQIRGLIKEWTRRV